MARKSLFARVKRRAMVSSYALLYFVLWIPVVVVIFLPFYIFRTFLAILKCLLRTDLDKLMHTRSSVLARDDHTGKPSWNLVVWLTQEGVMDLDKFCEYFHKDYVLKKKPNGRFQFPEYQQHYEKWWGYLFWRWEENFDIKDHIREYDGVHKADVVDHDRLVQIVKELTWKPWNPKKSPWEFLQIKNFQDGKGDGVEKSLLLFRIHHGLGDGYYILKLLMQDVCGISLENALGRPEYVRRSWYQKLILGFLFWVRTPYQVMEQLTTSWDVNQWHLPMEQLTRPMNAALTDCIPLDYIKSIKNMHHVSFTATVLAAITGGLRNHMLDRGIPVPTEMHTAVAVPMPGHPPKLRNHFIFSFVELPVGVNDPLKRLKKMDKNYTNLKRSTAPHVYFAKVPLIGALPTWGMVPFCINKLSTCLISNFPGTPEVPIFPDGTKVLDMMFNAGLGEGNVCLGFCLISYVDHIRLMSQADMGVLPTDSDVEQLNQKILEELETLKKLGTP